MRLKPRLRSISLSLWGSILARPLTTLYVIASAVIVAGFARWLEVGQALVILTVMFLVLLLLGLHRENRHEAAALKAELDTIHDLVNSQHDDLVERVEQLIATLHRAGVDVPDPEGKSL